MPSDDYKPTVRGGLKLKGGAKPTGVTKKKKKKVAAAASPSVREGKEVEEKKKKKEEDVTGGGGEMDDDDDNNEEEERLRELDPRGEDGKTASEREYEEMRRKRLQDRLRREGVKTHKERVEGLNKYLSTLSEHHDMPRIGPG